MRRPLVLLADDFVDACVMYAEYLRYHDFDVITVGDGLAAVNAAREHQPDIILLDVRMPVMTGLEALRVLRQDPQFAGVPVVALTAQALADERDNALRAGFDAFISKPLLPSQLIEQLRLLLAMRTASPERT
jgi:CheY-like chemotaxis protein